MDDEFKVLAAIVCAALLLLIAVLFAASFALGSWSCEGKARSFQEHEYTVQSGCMVKHEGRWIPLENIRGFD